MRTLSRCSIGLAVLLLLPAAPAAAQKTGTLSLTTSYDAPRVFCDIPLAAEPFQLVPLDGGKPIPFRTDITGAAKVDAPAGDYDVLLADTLAVAGACMTWRVPVTIEDRRTTKLALGNGNATMLRPWTDPTPPDTVRLAVATARWGEVLLDIDAGMRDGVGLLVDPGGLLLTSAWTVEADSVAIVSVAGGARVRAPVVARDPALGVAMLRVAPSVVAGLHPAALPPVEPPKVGSFISVLDRTPTGVTSGIWTPLEDAADGTLRVDLLAPQRFGGAPVVAPDGELVGIVTARPHETCETPAPNAVPIARVLPFVEQVRARLAELPVPDASPVAAWPADRFTSAQLDSIADASPLDRYEGLDELDAGHFRVRVETPVSLLVDARAYDARRRERLEKWTSKAKGEARACWANVPRPPERRHASGARPAIVEVHVDAKVEHSGGVSFGWIPLEKAHIRVDGDLSEARLYRNGERVTAISGGADWQRQHLHTPEGEWSDSSHVGWFAFPATILEPDANGAPPSIALVLLDRRHPDEPSCVTLAAEKAALLWNDFLAVYPGRTRADPKARPVTPRPQGPACAVPRDRPF